MSITENDKIKFGAVELDDDEREGKGAKVRITAMIDGDVLEALKVKAGKEHTKYQTLMNQMLRDALFAEKRNQVSDRLERIEKMVAGIAKVKGARAVGATKRTFLKKKTG